MFCNINPVWENGNNCALEDVIISVQKMQVFLCIFRIRYSNNSPLASKSAVRVIFSTSKIVSGLNTRSPSRNSEGFKPIAGEEVNSQFRRIPLPVYSTDTKRILVLISSSRSTPFLFLRRTSICSWSRSCFPPKSRH